LLLDAVSVVREASIPTCVLKGVALAHLVYPDPSYRVFGDVYLLVPSAMFASAIAVLHREMGTARCVPELRPGFDERFGKEALMRSVNGLELDVHRMFVEGAWGLTMDLDDLFSPSRRFVLAGQELDALPMPQQFLHACYAAAIGDWPPGSARSATSRNCSTSHNRSCTACSTSRVAGVPKPSSRAR
jgi:hypothetical protein